MAEQSDMYFCINKNILNIDSNVNNHARRFYLIKQDQQNIDDYLDQLVTSVSQEWRKEFSKHGNLQKIEGGYYVQFNKLRNHEIKFNNEDLKMFLKLVYYNLYDNEHFANIHNEWKTYCNNKQNAYQVIHGIEFNNLNLEYINLSNTSFTSCSFITAGLDNADFSKARLSNTNFSKTGLNKADFSGATLYKTNFSKVIMLLFTNFSEATLENADFSETTLNNANFFKAKFNDAVFLKAILINTNFLKAKFSDAVFLKAILYKTNFSEATLDKTNFSEATLANADFLNATLNSVTFNSTRCEKTNFYGTDFLTSTTNGMFFVPSKEKDISTIQLTNVNLNNINISEELKSALEYNRRKLMWETYYNYNEAPDSTTILIKLFNYLRHPIKTAVNLFWWSTNYGYSTLRIFLTLSIISLIFSGIYLLGHYTNHPLIELIPTNEVISYDNTTPCLTDVDVLLNFGQIFSRAIYFSVVTMTTLGFGDITVNPTSYCGYYIVSIQVILGYIGLGALITRIGTLFNSSGPTTTPKEYNKKHKRKN